MRILNLTLGILSFVLGTVGIILPVLPTVPFYLLAAFFFANSDEKFHSKLVNSKFYKENVEPFGNGKKIPLKIKIRAIVTVTIMLGISFYLTANWPIIRIIIVIIWLVHFYIIGYRK